MGSRHTAFTLRPRRRGPKGTDLKMQTIANKQYPLSAHSGEVQNGQYSSFQPTTHRGETPPGSIMIQRMLGASNNADAGNPWDCAVN